MESSSRYNDDNEWGFYIDIENPKPIGLSKKKMYHNHSQAIKKYNTFYEENKTIEENNQCYRNLFLEQENSYFIVRNGSRAIFTIAISFIIYAIL